MGKNLLTFLSIISMMIAYVSGSCTTGFWRISAMYDFGIILDVCNGQLSSAGVYSSAKFSCVGNSLYYYSWTQVSNCAGTADAQLNYSAYGVTDYVCGSCTEYMKVRTYQYETSDCTGSYNYTEFSVTTDACFNATDEDDGILVYAKMSCDATHGFLYRYATYDCSGSVTSTNITVAGICEDDRSKITIEYCGADSTATTTITTVIAVLLVVFAVGWQN